MPVVAATTVRDSCRMWPKEAKNSGSRGKRRDSGKLRLRDNSRLLRGKEEKL